MRVKPYVPKPVRSAAQRARRVGNHEWRHYWHRQPIQADTVLYESFAGNGMLCNPEAIFRELLSDPDFSQLRHIWSIAGDEMYRAAAAEFRGNAKVEIVRYRSPQYFRALATSQYLVNNATFPPEFTKRPEQVYVNTWHGTPLKSMGYDEPGGGPASKNVIRNFLAADYLLASSDYMAEQMYESAYRLDNVYKGHIVTEGAPRVDRQVLTEREALATRARLRAAGLSLRDDHKLVLYAPTWRGESFHLPTNDITLLASRIRALRKQLPDDHQVLLKVHQQVYRFAGEHPDIRDVLVPNDIPTNVVLGVTDVLVNDYSSIFFDFLSTERPIIFFTPDIQDYGSSRGLYLEPDELPGPVVTSVAALAQLVRACGTGSADDPLSSHAGAMADARKRFASLDDGGVTKRIIDIVFRDRHDGYNVRPARSDSRETVLIYLGGMQSNGITTSALNLLDNIDHDRFDVSVMYNYSRQRDRLKNEAAIHPRVRVIPRIGSMTLSKRQSRNRNRLLTVGMNAPRLDVDAMRDLFAQEWRRCFGSTHFDHVVDFSGYAGFWSFLLLRGSASSHSIWLHNDLLADQMREVNGQRPHEANLRGVFSTYAGYDNLVSVSEALMDVNADNLAEWAPADKHKFASNTINYHRIRTMAYGVPGLDESTVAAPISTNSLPDAIENLSRSYGLGAIDAEVSRRRTIERIVPAEGDLQTFVAVGRLSPEKNHRRLIEAFDLVHQQHSRTRLVVVGTGPLSGELKERAAELGLAGSVVFAGHQDNPYAIMAKSDCFVQSSDYEGQPMVILEARVLGLPVVSTNFSSVGGSLPEGTGLVTECTVESLADGMSAYLAGEVPNPPFDPEEYNRRAMDEFYRATGMADAGRI